MKLAAAQDCSNLIKRYQKEGSENLIANFWSLTIVKWLMNSVSPAFKYKRVGRNAHS